MASITIRRLDESLKRKLRVRAAQHGHSMEEEAREILKAGLAAQRGEKVGLGDAIRKRFAPFGGVELDIPERDPVRPPPNFSE